MDNTPEEMVEITLHEKTPPPPKPIQQTTIIEIVENDIKIEQEIEINVEVDQGTVVEEYVHFVPVRVQFNMPINFILH